MFAKVYLVVCARWLTAGATSAGLYWATSLLLAPETSQVVVYVWEVPSVVEIDDSPYPVNSTREQPIKLELPGGWHDLKLWRDGVAAYHNRFFIPPNSSAVHGVWIRNPESVTLPPPPE